MARKNRKYAEEFKRDTVKLLETSSKSVLQISDDLGTHQSVLRCWRKKFGQSQQDQNSHPELEEENNMEHHWRYRQDHYTESIDQYDNLQIL